MSYTAADRDRLRRELLEAERQVKNGDYEVTYRPVSEIRAALEIVERDLARQQASGPGAGPVRQIRVVSDKGL